jgi:hypothetical protein
MACDEKAVLFCNTCQETLPEKKFSRSDQRKQTAPRQCEACDEKEHQQMEEEDRQERVAEDARIRAQLGLHLYAMISDYSAGRWDHTGIDNVRFASTKPKDLIGTYDIVYYLTHDEYEGYDEPYAYEGTMKGTATFSETETEGPPVLSGNIEFHKGLAAYADNTFWHSYQDLRVVEDVENEERSGDSVWRCSMQATLGRRPGSFLCSLRCIDQRIPLPVIPHGLYRVTCSGHWGDDLKFIGEKNDLVQYDSNEEAIKGAEEELALYHNGPDGESSWITKHLQLPARVSNLILQYVSQKPPPFMFVEPGDLMMRIDWGEGMESYFVFRKRK